MRCPTCQSENEADSRYCRRCATPLPVEGSGPDAYTRTLIAAMDNLARGALFAGRYEIIEELGRGGMGTVYKAFDRKVNEVVALKLIRPEIGLNEKAVERFRNELRLARKIGHRYVCRLFDLGEAGLAHFITMEYVEGEDLKKFIRRAGPLNAVRTAAIGRQIAEGLAEAHRLGVVHRDLKPQNVMIDLEGNARIMDFGLARFLESDGATGSGVMLGTPDYMSPEQVDLKEVDARSDIYSLGVILYEMATGRVPFTGETPLSVAIKHKHEPARDARETNPLVPEPLAKTIAACLRKDREARIQTAEDLARDLGRVEQGSTVVVPEPRPAAGPVPAKPGAKARPLWIGLAGAGLLAMIAIVATFSSRGNRSGRGGRGPGSRVEDRFVPPPAGDALGGIAKIIGEKGAKDLGEAEKFIDTIRAYLPEKGPYVDAWNRLSERIKREKSQPAAKAPSGAKTASPEIQGEMQGLLTLVRERQEVQAAKDAMSAARREAEKTTTATAGLAFRLARFEEANADDAFAKNDYAGARALYAVLEKVYRLSTVCANEAACAAALKSLAEAYKAEAVRVPADKADPWILSYAEETGRQADAFLARGESANAGGAFLRACFLYETLRASAAPR